MDSSMFFQDWSGPLRTLIVGSLTYIGLVIWLRISRKRTLSKWNSFDFVVTVAFGSTLAATLLNKDVTLVEGLVALGLLVLLQFVITWLSVRYGWFLHVVKAKPTLLFHQGSFCRDAMLHQRVAETEVRTAIRAKGFGDLSDIEAVVLETDGSFSVVSTDKAGSRSAFTDIPRLDVEDKRGSGPV